MTLREQVARMLRFRAEGTRPTETTTLEPKGVMPNDPSTQHDGLHAEQGAAHPLNAEPSPPTTTVRLRFTLPDSVEYRRGCGWRADSDMRAEVWFVPRFGPA